MAHACYDVLRNVPAIAATREPSEATIAQLTVGHLVAGLVQLAAHAVHVEKHAEVAFLLLFALRIQYPRGFLQKGVFQFLIFRQIRFQGIGLEFFPSIKYLLDFRMRIGHCRCNAIGIEARENLLGTLIRVFHDIRQCLHRIPGRIRRELQRIFVVAHCR